jgi:purine-binding chemotaxis protein CheW
MEFKKVRERAKEERGRTRPPQPAQSQTPAAASSTTPPVSTPPASEPPTSVPPTAATARRVADPLGAFLAAYDEGGAIDTDHLDQSSPEDERRFLWFDLAGEAYAATIMDIREILKLVALTEVPRAPREILGVLSKRGVVMPVVDLASLLGLREPDPRVSADQRVLVVRDHDRVVGLRVDRVRQVVRLAQRAIEEVPLSLGSRHAHMLLGLGRARIEGSDSPQMLILLDIEAALAELALAVGIEVRPSATRGPQHA